MDYKVKCWVCYQALVVLDDVKKPKESDPDEVIAAHIKRYHPTASMK